MSGRLIGIAAGVAGSLFIAYCVYFDRKRRSDPNFRQKLIQKRLAERKLAEEKSSVGEFPDPRDQEAVQRFFITEIQLGEELLAVGDADGGVEHLANAVSVCAQPQQLLQVFNQTLPPEVFQLIVTRLPLIQKKNTSFPTMVEDDVE